MIKSKMFTENRLTYRGPEQLPDRMKAKEAEMQSEVVDEQILADRIQKIREIASNSQIDPKYKEQFNKRLNELLEEKMTELDVQLTQIELGSEIILQQIYQGALEEMEKLFSELETQVGLEKQSASERYAVEAPLLKENPESVFNRVLTRGVGLVYGVEFNEGLAVSNYNEESTDLGTIEFNFRELIKAQDISPEFANFIVQGHEARLQNALFLFLKGETNDAIDRIVSVIDDIKIAEESKPTLRKIERCRKESIKPEKRYLYYTRKALDEFYKSESRDGEFSGIRFKQAKAYQDFVVSLEPIVKAQEDFSKGDSQKERVLKNLGGKFLRISTFQIKASKRSARGFRLQRQKIQIPGDMEKFEEIKEHAKMSLLLAGREHFLKSNDRNYARYVGEAQTAISEKVNNEFSDNLDTAISLDNQNDKPIPTLEKTELQDTVQANTTLLIQEYDRIQRLLIAANTGHILKENMAFMARLSRIQKNLDGGEERDLMDIQVDFPGSLTVDYEKLHRISPQVHQTYSHIVTSLLQQSEFLNGEAIMHDPEVSDYRKCYMDFRKGSEGIRLTMSGIQEELERGADEPNYQMMALIHEDIGNYKNTKAYRMRSRPALRDHLMDLRKQVGSCPALDKALHDFENCVRDVEMFDQTCYALESMEGSVGNLTELLKEVGKFSVAIVAGTLFLPAGAIEAFGAIGGMAFISMMTSFGGTVGYALADWADGGRQAIKPENFAYSWARGTGMSFLAMGLSRPVGIVWGKLVKKINSVLAKSSIAPIRGFGRKGLELNADKLMQGATSGKANLWQRIFHEYIEESTQEGLQRIGDSIAPNAPWWGFTFSLLGSSYGVAKGVSTQGDFQATLDICGKVSEQGVSLEYADKQGMVDYLTERNAPPHILARVIAGKDVNETHNGVRIQITKSQTMPGIRRILADPEGKEAAGKAGLKADGKDGFSYSGDLGKLLPLLEKEYFVKQNILTGNITLTDIRGQETIFRRRMEVKMPKIDITLLNNLKKPETIAKASEVITNLWGRLANTGRRATAAQIKLFKSTLQLYKTIRDTVAKESRALADAIDGRIMEMAWNANHFESIFKAFFGAFGDYFRSTPPGYKKEV